MNCDAKHVDWKAFLQHYVPRAANRKCAETNINIEILQADDHLQILGIKMEALASKISKLPLTF